MAVVWVEAFIGIRGIETLDVFDAVFVTRRSIVFFVFEIFFIFYLNTFGVPIVFQ